MAAYPRFASKQEKTSTDGQTDLPQFHNMAKHNFYGHKVNLADAKTLQSILPRVMANNS